MKLRILDDAIRLRLDRDEVDAIGRGEAVIAQTGFPGGEQFTYQLQNGAETTASFSEGVMLIEIECTEAVAWAEDDTAVSLRGVQAGLNILVEKDFECLEPRPGESQDNRFSNPKSTTDCS